MKRWLVSWFIRCWKCDDWFIFVLEHQQERQAQEDGGTKDDDGAEEGDGVGVEKKFRCNEDVRKLLFEIMKADEQSVAVSNLIA
jgi:hypothetical protein